LDKRCSYGKNSPGWRESPNTDILFERLNGLYVRLIGANLKEWDMALFYLFNPDDIDIIYKSRSGLPEALVKGWVSCIVQVPILIMG
jgi:hypothetical protein